MRGTPPPTHTRTHTHRHTPKQTHTETDTQTHILELFFGCSLVFFWTARPPASPPLFCRGIRMWTKYGWRNRNTSAVRAPSLLQSPSALSTTLAALHLLISFPLPPFPHSHLLISFSFPPFLILTSSFPFRFPLSSFSPPHFLSLSSFPHSHTSPSSLAAMCMAVPLLVCSLVVCNASAQNAAGW